MKALSYIAGVIVALILIAALTALPGALVWFLWNNALVPALAEGAVREISFFTAWGFWLLIGTFARLFVPAKSSGERRST